ncbi:serine/threonine protein kinase [Actinophytocola sp. KF-1]
MGELTRIDDGPVATVYSGHRGGVPMALKVFPRRFDKRTLSAFTKEQAKLATVRRVPSILQVTAVGEADGGASALWMELCAHSLARLMERTGRLAATDVVVLGHAMATALAAAHSAGVIHGGVSPGNVLFRFTGDPVLSDFGVTLRHAFSRDPLHAIEYLPPESLRSGTLNESTDLYGLGAVLHFALSGRSPHPGRLGEQPGERVLRILGEPVPALTVPNVPVGLSTLVARLLSATPERRPPDAATVARQLATMLPATTPHPPQEDWDDFVPSPQPPRATPAYRPQPPQDAFDDFGGGHYPAPRIPPLPPGGPAPGTPFPATAPVAANPGTPRATGPFVPPFPAATPSPATTATPIPTTAPAPAHPAGAPSAPVSAAEPVAGPAADAVVPEAVLGTESPVPATEPGNPPDAPGEARPPVAANVLAPVSVPVAPAQAASPGAEPVIEPTPSRGVTQPASPTPGTVVPAPVAGVSLPATAAPDTPRPPVPPATPAVVLGPQRLPLAPPPVAAPPEFLPTDRIPATYGDDDVFSDFGDLSREHGRSGVKLLTTVSPGKPKKRGRLIRYDLLAGAALLLALLAMVPLLLLRGDPEEISTAPQVPSAGGAGDVEVELAEPTDLTDKVRLTWTASREFDFAVVVAAEGREAKVLLAERNHSMTVDVEPGLRYCFQVQATDGDGVYTSDPVPLRGATCRE